MILVIDIGNTNMEIGIFQGDVLRNAFRLGTNRDSTSDEIGLLISQYFIFCGMNREEVEAVVIASVVPQVMHSMGNAIRKYFKGKTPYVVGENLPIRIQNRYENPKEVGADRLVNAYAAHRKYGGPAIVVDFGTATTFDAIGADGAYLGGAIYPGIKISMDALFQKAARLPRVELVNPGSIIGENTVASLQAGAIYGYVGAVENIVSKMKMQLGQAKVIATGGFSRLIGKETLIFDGVDTKLTLTGLMMVYRDHKAR